MDKHISIQIPGSWDELTDWQLKKISSMVNKSGTVFNFMTWMYLNKTKWYQFKKIINLRIVNNEVPLSELRKHFDWIYTNVNRTIFPKHKKYEKPMDRMVNLTIEEFSIADDLNNSYLETRKIAYLRYLCAILYRKENEPYNHLHLEKVYLKRFEKENFEFLLAVHTAFTGSKKGIVERFTNVYPKLKKAQRSNKKAGMLDVVLEMSGQKFGNYEQTKNTLVHTFLTNMDESILKQKQIAENNGKKGRS